MGRIWGNKLPQRSPPKNEPPQRSLTTQDHPEVADYPWVLTTPEVAGPAEVAGPP